MNSHMYFCEFGEEGARKSRGQETEEKVVSRWAEGQWNS